MINGTIEFNFKDNITGINGFGDDFGRGVLINNYLHYVVNNRTFIDNTGAGKPLEQCIWLGSDDNEPLRDEVLKKINAVIFRRLAPDGCDFFKENKGLRLMIPDYDKTTFDEKINTIYSGVVCNVTTGEYLTITDEIRPFLERSAAILTEILDRHAREKENELRTNPEKERAKVETAPDPTAINCDVLKITGVRAGWYEPTARTDRQNQSQSQNTTAPTAPTAGDVPAPVGVPVINQNIFNTLNLPTAPTAGDVPAPVGVQDTPHNVARLAELSTGAVYVVNYFGGWLGKEYAKMREKGNAPAPVDMWLKFDPRAITEANGATVSGNQSKLINDGANELANTKLEFVIFEGEKNGKHIKRTYETHFIQAVIADTVTDKNGVAEKKIKYVKIDPFFLTNDTPIIPTKKLFSGGDFRGALTAGDVGGAVTWILNRYKKGVSIPWRDVFDNITFTDSNQRRVKIKILENIAARGFVVEKVGRVGFTVKETAPDDKKQATPEPAPKKRGRPRKNDKK